VGAHSILLGSELQGIEEVTAAANFSDAKSD
jgi:hypothetical protein